MEDGLTEGRCDRFVADEEDFRLIPLCIPFNILRTAIRRLGSGSGVRRRIGRFDIADGDIGFGLRVFNHTESGNDMAIGVSNLQFEVDD